MDGVKNESEARVEELKEGSSARLTTGFLLGVDGVDGCVVKLLDDDCCTVKSVNVDSCGFVNISEVLP